MGTTRESKASPKAKAAGTPAKKKAARKTTAKAAASPKAAKKTTKKAAAKAAPVRRAAAARPKKAAAQASPKASPRAASESAERPKRAKASPQVELPPAAVVPPAPARAPERDPREERRARLEEKLALRSAALREQQQQRQGASAPAPRPEHDARRDADSRPRTAPAPAPERRPSSEAAYRPDLPFDPKVFRPQAAGSAATPAARPQPAQAPASPPGLAVDGEPGEGGGRRRRRRRRRRRGGGEGAAAMEGVQPQQPQPVIAAPPPRPAAAPSFEGGAQSSDPGLPGEGGGRRRRRRRRRRGGGGEAGMEQQPRPVAAAAPAQAQPVGVRRPAFQAPARPQSPWREPADDFDSRRGGRRRRGRGRDFQGPLPWDPDREAPAVNILPDRDPFSELVSIDPEERIDLETDTDEISMRVVDLITPIGKGQRALIVAPPKTGKTTLLMQLARAITENHPEIELIVMLIDERPEEVTAFRRAGYGEVLASSNDEPLHRHLKLTQHVWEVAKRRVIEGKDVCILLDSITRMARAHNVASSGNRTMSGGLDTRALERPKRFFGAARKILGGGSLTILATALIDTGSRMDEIIFQEFKGTGNSELQLDRRLAERRIWPAIDIQKSGTRKEEKLFEKDEYEGVIALRRALSGLPPAEAMQMLLSRLNTYRTNREFLLDVARKAAAAL